MDKHIKALATCYLIFGAMGLLAFLVILFVTVLGSGLAAMDDPKAGLILGTIGTLGLAIAAFVSLPNIIAGFGLLKYRGWSRILTIVLSILNLVCFPFGTALGIYGLWVLFNAEVVDKFTAQPST